MVVLNLLVSHAKHQYFGNDSRWKMVKTFSFEIISWFPDPVYHICLIVREFFF